MKRLVCLAVVPLLQGCFFVYIPGGMVSSISDAVTGDKGEHCIGREATVGSRVTDGQRYATVTHVSGESSRCKNPHTPIRAELQFD